MHLDVYSVCNAYSPRARTVLFVFWGPKGLIVCSIVEFSQEFKYPFLTKIRLDNFSQIHSKEGTPQIAFLHFASTNVFSYTQWAF